jgi:hypothetical protein
MSPQHLQHLLRQAIIKTIQGIDAPPRIIKSWSDIKVVNAEKDIISF